MLLQVEIFGSWFTGHNLTLHGVYQDRSIPSVKDHYLKMILKSPSFREINSTLHFFQNDEEFKIDLRVGDIFYSSWPRACIHYS